MSDPRVPPAVEPAKTVDERVADNEARLVEADRRLAAAEAVPRVGYAVLGSSGPVLRDVLMPNGGVVRVLRRDVYERALRATALAYWP